jgi:tetratricopeptide (TPR) repeat protein
VRAYRLAFELDPDAFDPTQLNAYAGVLDEVGDYATCEKIAKLLFVAAKDDKMWQTCAWNHEACALIGAGKFTRAIELAEKAVAENPIAANKEAFAATLLRAQSKLQPATPATSAASIAAVNSEYVAGTVFAQLAAGEHALVAARLGERDWRVRRGAIAASRFRFSSENAVAVTARARAAAAEIMAASVGSTDADAVLCRAIAHSIREQAHFARDPVVALGDRMTRGAFYAEFRARGGVVLGEAPVATVAFVDRVVVPNTKIARASDYIALLRDLSALTPREALAQFDLGPDDYIEVSKAWAAAMADDPTLAPMLAAGLAAKS